MNNALAKIQKHHITGITKHHIIKEYNTWFINQEWFSKNPRNPWRLDVEKNQKDEDAILKDVVSLCLHTEICKQLGLSVVDIMKMDLATYELIRDMVIKEAERKHKQTEQLAKETQDKQKKLLGEVNGAGTKQRSDV